jgi:hypothetical protein
VTRRAEQRQNGRVKRIEIALEVGPIDPETVERLKSAGFTVFKGNRSWRVVAETAPKDGQPVLTQAVTFANDILIDFRLDPLHTPPSVTLRYPDGVLDRAIGELVLEDARRASDPDPIPRPKRKWWQKQMELGLGERKGD